MHQVSDGQRRRVQVDLYFLWYFFIVITMHNIYVYYVYIFLYICTTYTSIYKYSLLRIYSYIHIYIPHIFVYKYSYYAYMYVYIYIHDCSYTCYTLEYKFLRFWHYWYKRYLMLHIDIVYRYMKTNFIDIFTDFLGPYPSIQDFTIRWSYCIVRCSCKTGYSFIYLY